MKQLEILLGQLRCFSEENVFEKIKRYRSLSLEILPFCTEELYQLLLEFKTSDILKQLYSEVVLNNLVELKTIFTKEYKGVASYAKITYGFLLGELMYEAFKFSSIKEKAKLLSIISQASDSSKQPKFHIALYHSNNFCEMLIRDKEVVSEFFVSLVKEENILRASNLSSVEEANQFALRLGYAYFSYKNDFYVPKEEGAKKIYL